MKDTQTEHPTPAVKRLLKQFHDLRKAIREVADRIVERSEDPHRQVRYASISEGLRPPIDDS